MPSQPKYPGVQLGAERSFDTCRICGEQRPREPGWVVRNEAPHWVHESCKDWSAEPFPFAWKIETTRRLAGELRRAYHEVVAFGRELQKTNREWPDSALLRLRLLHDLSEQAKRTLAKALKHYERL